MNNIEALKLALDGVKVRKVCWDEGEYCVVQDRELVNEDGEDKGFDYFDHDDDQWERYVRKESIINIVQEMNGHPERFESFNGEKWVRFSDCGHKILNAKWNYSTMDDKIFLVESRYGHKEIVRRKPQ